MGKQIGVGVISLGWVGRLHARSYRAPTEHCQGPGAEMRLVATCGLMEAARDEAVATLEFERAYADYHELPAGSKVDVVSICSPNFPHHEVVLTAVTARKPLWIEKSMGASAAQSRQITEAANAAGLITVVGFNYHHALAIECARQLIRDDRIGCITNVHYWLIADCGSSFEGPLTWRYSRDKGGSGVIGNLLSHGADLVQYLVGRIKSVTATPVQFTPKCPVPTKTGVGYSGWEVPDELGPVENEDQAAVLARLEGGAVATMEASRAAVGSRAEYIAEVYGAGGSPRWNFEHLNDLFVCTDRDQEFQGYTCVMAGPDFPSFGILQPGVGVSMGFDDMKIVRAAQFIESVLTDEQLTPPVASGWAAAEIDEAAVVSAADGRRHGVPGMTGRTAQGS